MKGSRSLSHYRQKLLITIGAFLLGNSAFAQEATPTSKAPDFFGTIYTNPTFIGLMIAIIFMMIMILALNEIMKSVLHHKREMLKKNKNKGGIVPLLIGFALFIPGLSNAQTAAPVEEVAKQLPEFPSEWYGLNGFVFWPMVLFLIFEVLVAVFILNQIKILLYKPKAEVVAEEKPVVTLLDRFNASVSIEKEHDILLDHNYDGIQELDNNLPPWWKYGFYITIVFAFVYMAHYHIFKTGDLQLAELRNENLYAEQQIAEYKKNAANLVDENNVTLLTDAAALSEGKALFAEKCVACHGQVGEGTTIGPNLTDDYWIHGGGIKDIFYSVKFGWIEKGMRSWQDELNARQMHVVSSYIKSLRGSNPPNAKEKQGELYIEEGSEPIVTDTLKTNDTIPEIVNEN